MTSALIPEQGVSPLVPVLANQIIEMIRREAYPPGFRLTEHLLCAELRVSRSPVRKALRLLESTGAVTSQPQKGFVVATAPEKLGKLAVAASADSDESVYAAIADDRVEGRLPAEISESVVVERYASNRRQVQRVLNRMAREGIIERKPGRGWSFLPLMNTLEAHRESYLFRSIIEPPALLQPGYQIDMQELEKCYREQLDMLAGGIEKWPRSELFRVGVHLHETIIAGANNRLLLEALRRVNQQRRLVEYRSKQDRSTLREQCDEHLVLIDLIRRRELREASTYLRDHLEGARLRKAPEA